MYRKHQKQFNTLIDSIIAGTGVRKILLKVTPGGGKSAIPIIACKLIRARLADGLLWIVPRKSLQDQAERNFIDPYFREMIGHDFKIRSSTNDDNPRRGLHGFVTTYQAIGQDDAQTVYFEIARQRYIVVLDEFHHVEQGGIWHQALKHIVKNASYLILMTGTLERGDEKKIAFIPYQKADEDSYIPDLESSDMHVIEYTRSDALSEKAIIPLKFYLSDGAAEWIDKEGLHMQIDSLAKEHRKNIASQAIFTVLNSEYAFELLNKALHQWLKHKEKNPGSKLLVVTSNFKRAKIIIKTVQEYGLNAEIATSHRPTEAAHAIKRFKMGYTEILVTIAMAYEGMDVPEISHICCLTNIRSTPWIEQMVARVVRIDRNAGPYESQTGFIFAPDDVHFREIVNQIRKEQLPYARHSGEQREMFEKSEFPGERETIKALASKMTGNREMNLGPVHVSFLNRAQTPKDEETDLRKKIEEHVRLYSYLGRYRNGTINGEIVREFEKSRQDMTIPELRRCLEFVRKTYPIEKVRGCGRRVPTKVVRWYG